MSTELEAFKADVKDQLEGMRGDLKDLTKAFRELIRLDGDMKRINDAVQYIDRKVNSQEERIRTLEMSASSDRVRVGHSERFIWLMVSLGTGLIGSLLTGLLKG